MKTISIVTGCYNEEENAAELIQRVREVMANVIVQFSDDKFFCFPFGLSLTGILARV